MKLEVEMPSQASMVSIWPEIKSVLWSRKEKLLSKQFKTVSQQMAM